MIEAGVEGNPTLECTSTVIIFIFSISININVPVVALVHLLQIASKAGSSLSGISSPGTPGTEAYISHTACGRHDVATEVLTCAAKVRIYLYPNYPVCLNHVLLLEVRGNHAKYE